MPANTKVLVTGSNGQVGSELRELANDFPQYAFSFLTREEAPLDNDALLAQAVNNFKPDVIINCAAYTAVDKAESDRKAAFQINATAVGTLARIARETGARFLHISTDYVFDGTVQSPRREEDAVSPVNVYGESKLAGETAALAENPDSVIVRTSWVYSAYGKNFVKTMIRLMAEKEFITVVNDQCGSPTYAADLAEALLQMAGNGRWTPGVYHFSNEGVITWFDFAREIATEIKSHCEVKAATSASFPTPAKRPAYSVMDKSKIEQVYGIKPKPWQESLSRCLKRLTANEPID